MDLLRFTIDCNNEDMQQLLQKIRSYFRRIFLKLLCFRVLMKTSFPLSWHRLPRLINNYYTWWIAEKCEKERREYGGATGGRR